MNQSSSNHTNLQEDFLLEGSASSHEELRHEDFSLEAAPFDDSLGNPLDAEPVQESLLLNTEDCEQPEASAQIDLEGMDKPLHAVSICHDANPVKTVSFQHANTLLESLEAQDVPVHYQCREGYCGSCRTQLLEGEVHYTEEPMAWINDDEILPCCCIPKTAIRIKLS